MNEPTEQTEQSGEKKIWQTPEIHEQTVRSATTKGKFTSPGEPSPGSGPGS